MAEAHKGHFQWSFCRRDWGTPPTIHDYDNPQVGPWPTRDPIGYKGGINLYAYVLNNGVNSTDPQGLGFWAGVGEGLIGLAVGLAVGAIAVAFLPAAALAVASTTVAIAGAAMVGVNLGEAIGGRDFSGKKLSSDRRAELAGEAVVGLLAIGATATKAWGKGAENDAAWAKENYGLERVQDSWSKRGVADEDVGKPDATWNPWKTVTKLLPTGPDSMARYAWPYGELGSQIDGTSIKSVCHQ
jgi:uncharacterized protein RhaS with RHS repeats